MPRRGSLAGAARRTAPARVKLDENGGAMTQTMLAGLLLTLAIAQSTAPESALDARVKSFLDASRGTWRDWNVPEEDGRILRDLVLKKRFRRGLEIGTSTGHSSIWIAWALAKTDGRLVTLEIDPDRHAQARANFEKAGLASRIDARLGDAHELVKQLPGPFDFVFSDADKDWYLQYFKDVDPKLEVGGCFTAHNVIGSGGRGAREFLDYVKTLPNYTTTVETGSGEGISISCKTAR
jgi:predicted O-methyltransferase YrrM